MARGRKSDAFKVLIQKIQEKIFEDHEIAPLPYEGLDLFEAYSQGIMLGLLDRLERIESTEADAATEAIQYASSHFGELFRLERVRNKSRKEKLEIAKQTIRYFIGGLNPKLAALKKRMLLLIEYDHITKTISPLGEKDRKTWLIRHEKINRTKAEGLAYDCTPGEIAKEVLAHRHKPMSSSQIARQLTQAYKDVEKGKLP